MPATLELVFCASAFALSLGIPMGIYSAINRRGLLTGFIQIEPDDGTVARVDDLQAGDFVSAGAPVFALISSRDVLAIVES